MRQGDKVPVTIAGQVVAQATVRELGDGTVTLVVPGTLVVMAVRTEIAPDPQQTAVPETETLITGVDRTSADSTVVEPAGDATVVEQTDGGTPEASLPEPTAPSTGEPVTASEGAAVVEQPQANPTVSDEGNASAEPA